MEKRFELARPVDGDRELAETVVARPRHTVVEPKLDGVRILVHCTPEGVYMTTRHVNKDGSWREVQANFPQYADNPALLAHGRLGYTVFDGELLAQVETDTLPATAGLVQSLSHVAQEAQLRQGWAVVHVFDIPYFHGQDLRGHPWHARRELLDAEGGPMKGTRLERMRCFRSALADQRIAHAERVVNDGMEGVVLKDPSARYGEGWVRWKQRFTTDAQVTGWYGGGGKYEGLVGSLEMSVVDKRTGALRVIASASPGTDAVRREITEILREKTPDEIVALGWVAEMEAQCLTSGGSLRHPRIVRWRSDRSTPNELDFPE